MNNVSDQYINQCLSVECAQELIIFLLDLFTSKTASKLEPRYSLSVLSGPGKNVGRVSLGDVTAHNRVQD